MVTLTEFLLARIAEDEAVAHRFDTTAYREWTYRPYGDRLGGECVPMGGQVSISEDWHDTGYVGVSDHIARHDPARVLAECAAKRAVVLTLTAWEPDSAPPPRVETAEHDAWRMLTALAQPHADHPDFDEAWRA